MTSIDIKNDAFSCRQNDDFAVIKILKAGKAILTTVESKENLMSILATIKDSPEIKGIAMLYSDEYSGSDDYRRFLCENLDEKPSTDKRRYTITYKSAIIQFLEIISKYPIPIVGGMNGDIGPVSLGLNLALDLRVASEKTTFVNPNLQLGFPPSALLSFHLVRSFGSSRATELMLTKSKFSVHEALDLGLITQIVSKNELESKCLERLRELKSIAPHALVETRRILQPSVNEIRNHIDAVFEAFLRSLYKMKS